MQRSPMMEASRKTVSQRYVQAFNNQSLPYHQREAPGWYVHLLENRDFRVTTILIKSHLILLSIVYLTCNSRGATERFVSVMIEMVATLIQGLEIFEVSFTQFMFQIYVQNFSITASVQDLCDSVSSSCRVFGPFSLIMFSVMDKIYK